MRKTILLAAFAAAILLVTGNLSLFAQRGGRAQEIIEVRIASPLPQQSPWGRALDRIAAEWSRITDGQVRPRVLHGGTEGTEAKMHLSLASNTIQAAVFTSFGLNQIDPRVMTMSAPFLIRNEDELNVVMSEVQGDLEGRINSGDYFLVAWSKSGFVNIFSREPVFTPDDLKRLRLASNADASDLNTAFKTMGFQVVDTDAADLGPKLATGAITAVYQSPASIAAYQLHSYMRNMLTVNLAPFLGGVVINQVTWRRIGALDPRYQQQIINVTRQIAQGLDNDMQKTVNDAIIAMKRDGLVVNEPTPAQEQLWYAEMERATPVLLGATFDRDLYRKIDDVLARYRRGR